MREPLKDYERKALQAIALGRIPASEVVRARLKRRGLIARSVFVDPKRVYVLTEAGHRALSREGNP